jgi:hypothetical protein
LKSHQFHIGLFMGAVAALNIAAVRAVLVHAGLTNELLAVGAVPMVTALAIGLGIAYQRHGSSPYLLGFELFGAMALALYVVLASCIPDRTIGPYLRPLMEPLARIVGTDRSVVLMPIAYYSVAVAALALPQVAFALLGGFLSRRFKFMIVGR